MINKQLDTLFARWEKATKQDGLLNFCKDGLVYQREDTETIWNQSERRIVFLQKESLIPNLTDSRNIINNKEDKWFTDRLYGSRLAAWLYGLTHTTNTGFPAIETAFNKEVQVDTIHNIPFALVNINKQATEVASSNARIYAYADKYKQYLKEELAILNSNVCVCCGDVVFKVLKDVMFPHSPFIKVNEWIYYERYTQTIIINSFLPTARKTNEDIYETMLVKLIEGLRIPTHELSSLDRYITTE